MIAQNESGPVTKEEWAQCRAEARQAMPGQLAGKAIPDVLLPYQQRLLATTASSALTVAEKSRRIGFTWGVASDAVLTSAAARDAGGMDTLYIGYNIDMAREFIDTAAMWARAFGQVASEVDEHVFLDQAADGSSKQIQAYRITFASGFEIVALSSRPRSLRGKQGYVIIDEAAFHDDLPGLLKAALAMLIWGGKVLVISTHDGDANAFNTLVQDIRAGRQPGTVIKVTFDEALQDGLYERICLTTGSTWSPQAEADWRAMIVGFYGDGADEELFVIPSSGSGTYIPALLIERQQRADIPVLRWARDAAFLHLSAETRRAEAFEFCQNELLPSLEAMDRDLESFLGEDFAMSSDLTVLWIVQRRRDMVRECRFMVELRQIPYAQQKQILYYVLNRVPKFTGAAMDATGNGAPLAQETATDFGLALVQQVKINVAWYEDITPKFKAAFEDGLTVMPRDLDVYNDHRALKLVRGVAQVQRQEQEAGKGEDAAAQKSGKLKRHGDSAIAHMMAIYAAQAEGNDGLLKWYAAQASQARRGPAARLAA